MSAYEVVFYSNNNHSLFEIFPLRYIPQRRLVFQPPTAPSLTTVPICTFKHKSDTFRAD